MNKKHEVKSLSDDELLVRLSNVLKDSRRVESVLVAHVAEVDARRLYASEASPSMHKYCVDVSNLSDAEAYLRIKAARTSRRYPVLLTMLEDGRLHLSGIAVLTPHLRTLIAAKSRPGPPTDTAPESPDQRAEVEPLSPARFKVQFTASAELRDKLDRLAALMPGSDLASVIEGAVTEKLERLEAKRFGKTKAEKERGTSRHGAGCARNLCCGQALRVGARRGAMYV